MNIVFVVDHYLSETDGTIITARRFKDELTKLGHVVRIVSYGVSGENKYGLKENRIPIVSRVSKKSNVTFAKYDKKVLTKALDGADIVHLFLPFSVERKTLKLAKKMNIPVCAAFHLHPENITKNAGIKKCPKFLRSYIYRRWRKSIYDKVSHIHCPSTLIKDELEKHKYKAKLHVISNGISKDFVPQVKEVYSKKDKFEILMVGRFAAEKRQDLLINAIMNSKYKDKINVTFAGSGPKKKKLMKMSQNLPNKPSFEFLPKNQLLKKIYESDLYIHAADVEIEGISCLEAFSCGLVPLIGNAKQSATKQFIIDDRCMFEAGNSDSLRDKMDYWIENPLELSKMSKKYIESATEYKIENSVKLMLNMFDEVIKDNQKKKFITPY